MSADLDPDQTACFAKCAVHCTAFFCLNLQFKKIETSIFVNIYYLSKHLIKKIDRWRARALVYPPLDD